jgi:transcriptional regulator with XRE-family HTH domain
MKFNRIKEVLFKQDLKNKDLAALMGVFPQSVSGWITNKHQPSIERLFEMAKKLNVTVTDLLVEDNPL